MAGSGVPTPSHVPMQLGRAGKSQHPEEPSCLLMASKENRHFTWASRNLYKLEHRQLRNRAVAS